DSLQALAKLHKKDPAGELVVALKRQDAASEDSAAGALSELGELLASQPAAALAAQRSTCEQLALNGKRELSRQIAFGALVTIDQSFDKAEKLAEQNPQRLADLMAAAVRVPDGKLRATIFPRAAALVRESDASVRRAAMGALPNLPGHEAETLEQLTRCVREKIEPEAAIAALDQLPRGDWSAATAGPVADSLVVYLATLSIKQRTNATARTATALATSLLGRLPTSEGAALRRRLDDLAVQIVKLGTVRENMRFDNSVVVVSAGWPVKIEFHNTDNMPHNLAVATPSSLADVGMAADALALKPEARERNFVPDMPQILHATRLLQDGESDSLTFVAPKQPGTYPLVCTYPGHWRRMYAALVVVPDRAAYLKSHSQLASAEKLLGLPEFTREYTIEDLVPSVTSLKSGRSFETGKMWFTTASCSSCHQIKGQGGNIGPDLTEVAKRYKPQEILREIIDPSAVINEKFAAVEILLNDGRTVRGVIAEQNPKQIKLMPLGLTPGVCEPIVVARADIEENGITKSKISPMPKGLLNVMQQEQILDLLAYVLSGGDPKNPVFH
ncbi:MAG: c-type cytochrome, partial [Planctomycetia bacterium]|nr:c-type cytochrome [Planctomycetia bacterium]